jgi:hypothetical protein
MNAYTKIDALAAYLGVEPSEIGRVPYDDAMFEASGEEWLVLTDSEADDRAKDDILNSVWAFRPEFLAAHTVKGVDAEAIELIQDNGKCESNNPVLLRLIDDVEHFVADAIKADGRGHFLNRYDSEEIELKVNGKVALFAYRVN